MEKIKEKIAKFVYKKEFSSWKPLFRAESRGYIPMYFKGRLFIIAYTLSIYLICILWIYIGYAIIGAFGVKVYVNFIFTFCLVVMTILW